ncbi:hypothetical protein ONZ43_g7173 [Nemania bipapillata]|uniref:Uncharacterized protein n=1 Tax=Nemania bipapillata TaxID=110536 RepID=A0ACC2HUB0_9PEZI|nr:hypothetical protein ONZ43_g7173 [Nemania bipapillata]
MDTLSQEIIDNIVSFIPQRVGEEDVPAWKRRGLPPALPALATVSRRFQKAVEWRTFKELHIKTSDVELDEFESILLPIRRNYLRHLHVNLLVSPSPSEPDDGRENYYETDRDRQADRKASTAQLRRLWNFLGSWSQNSPSSQRVPNVSFTLRTAPQDVYGKNGYGLPPFAFSLLDLTDDVESFPALPLVHSFKTPNTVRIWNPRVLVALASKMPKAEQIAWVLDECDDDWGRYYSIDKQYRDGIVQAIQAMRLPASVKDFFCSLKKPSYSEPGQELPKFIKKGAHDPVSCAMRELTRHCVKVSLKGSFHPSLFDPPISGPVASCWQQTTNLRVEMALCSPDGSWLFQPQSLVQGVDLPEGLLDCTQLPPGYAETEEENEEAIDYFEDWQSVIFPPRKIEYNRVELIPNDEKLNALLVAFARGCAKMPVLEIAIVHIEYENDDNWPFQIICVAASHRLGYWEEAMDVNPNTWRFYLHTNEWQPTKATLAVLKEVGEERNGEPSTVCFLQWGDFYE